MNETHSMPGETQGIENILYDIAIIGAGPAGSTFAREVSGHGLKVLLIDGQDGDHKKPCGGLLAPDAQKLMATYDFTLPKDVLVDPQVFSVKTVDIETGVTGNYQRFYLNMDRYKFDSFLVSMVGDDVDVVNGRCLKIQKGDSNFELTVATQGRELNIKSRFLVGADGASSRVRKQFFNAPIYTYVAIQEWYEYKQEDNLYYSCIFDHGTSNSCSWVIHKNEHIIFGGCFDKKDCQKNFEEQKRRVQDRLHIDLSKPCGREACQAFRPRRRKDFVTGHDGVYLIGEAAGFISASSLEGISSAMYSGEKLAEAFIEALQYSIDDKKLSKLYKKKTAKLKNKLMMKVIKHWFLFTPFTRNIIMKSGISSLSIKRMKNK